MIRRYIILACFLALSCRRGPRPMKPGEKPPEVKMAEVKKAPEVKCPLAGTGSSCNTIAIAGSEQPVTVVNGKPPLFTGGALPNGTYVLTASELISAKETAGPNGKTEHFTFTLEGEGASRTMKLVQARPGCPLSRETLAVSFEGHQVKSSLKCPACPAGDVCDGVQDYSWDGTTLLVARQMGDVTAALTFKRAP